MLDPATQILEGVVLGQAIAGKGKRKERALRCLSLSLSPSLSAHLVHAGHGAMLGHACLCAVMRGILNGPGALRSSKICELAVAVPWHVATF